MQPTKLIVCRQLCQECKSVGFVGRNLWNDWEYDGVDPETSLTGTGNGQGFDYFNNPSTKTFMFKLSVNF